MSDHFLDMLADRIAGQVAEKVASRLSQPAVVQKVLFTISEAAVSLGCSKRALEQMIFERKIQVVRRGRRVYIHKKDLEEFIEQNRV